MLYLFEMAWVINGVKYMARACAASGMEARRVACFNITELTKEFDGKDVLIEKSYERYYWAGSLKPALLDFWHEFGYKPEEKKFIKSL